MSMHSLRILLLCIGSSVYFVPSANGQEEDADPGPLSVSGSLVDFASDVVPIFKAKCLQCHGPDEAKNDFRVDDSELMMDYLEPKDLESSSIWTDYLVTDDPDMRMPPPGHETVTALSGSELATIRLWIEEGARWPEEVQFSDDENAAAESEDEVEPATKSVAARVWIFQGLFHPASVHFPVALLTVSAAFVLFSFFKPETCEPVAFHCLWIGALGAIASCAMGWAYAQSEGYGAGYSFDIQNSAIDRHRWLGIVVAIIAVILIPVARSVIRKGGTGRRAMWFLGSLLMVAAVSTAGYQGGELVFGEDHYINEFERLFPEMKDDAGDNVASDPGEDQVGGQGGQDSARVSSDAASEDETGDIEETDTEEGATEGETAE